LSAPAVPLIGDLMRYTISPWLGRLMWPRILKKCSGQMPAQGRGTFSNRWRSKTRRPG